MKRFLIGLFIGSAMAAVGAQTPGSPIAIRPMAYINGNGLANGIIQVPAGTAAINALGIGAANTGFYSSSASNVSMVTNGTAQWLSGSGIFRMASTTQLCWASGGADATSCDTTLTRTAAGSVLLAGTTPLLNFGSRDATTSTANGLLNITDNGGTVGIQFNNGTAAPTISSCATGTITTGSRNTAGQVTATGAASCGIAFGAPAWTNAPFCTIANQTANRGNISTITTTVLTITNLTAGDVVNWNCIGRI